MYPQRKRDSSKLLSGSVIKLFFMCLFFCQPFVLVYTRIREVQYFRLWPKFSCKGSNYSCNSRLMWISVPIQGTPYTSICFIPIHNNMLCICENNMRIIAFENRLRTYIRTIIYCVLFII